MYVFPVYIGASEASPENASVGRVKERSLVSGLSNFPFGFVDSFGSEDETKPRFKESGKNILKEVQRLKKIATVAERKNHEDVQHCSRRLPRRGSLSLLRKKPKPAKKIRPVSRSW